jgi:hypothetical protein
MTKADQQKNLIHRVTYMMAERLTLKDSLQERVIKMDVVPGSMGVTYENKDGTYYTEVWETIKDSYDLKFKSYSRKELLEI